MWKMIFLLWCSVWCLVMADTTRKVKAQNKNQLSHTITLLEFPRVWFLSCTDFLEFVSESLALEKLCVFPQRQDHTMMGNRHSASHTAGKFLEWLSFCSALQFLFTTRIWQPPNIQYGSHGQPTVTQWAHRDQCAVRRSCSVTCTWKEVKVSRKSLFKTFYIISSGRRCCSPEGLTLNSELMGLLLPLLMPDRGWDERVFQSELCVRLLFIWHWEVLPLIVHCLVESGSPWALSHHCHSFWNKLLHVFKVILPKKKTTAIYPNLWYFTRS